MSLNGKHGYRVTSSNKRLTHKTELFPHLKYCSVLCEMKLTNKEYVWKQSVNTTDMLITNQGQPSEWNANRNGHMNENYIPERDRSTSAHTANTLRRLSHYMWRIKQWLDATLTSPKWKQKNHCYSNSGSLSIIAADFTSVGYCYLSRSVRLLKIILTFFTKNEIDYFYRKKITH